MNQRIEEAERPFPLIGYAIVEDLCEDWSHWDGAITGPGNPRGANLSWLDPIPFIEKRAYDEAMELVEMLRKLVKHFHGMKFDKLRKEPYPPGSIQVRTQEALDAIEKLKKLHVGCNQQKGETK